MATEPIIAQGPAPGSKPMPLKRSELGLWLASFAGAWAWLVHLVGSFALVAAARVHDSKLVLHLLSLITFTIAMAGALVCLRIWRGTTPPEPRSSNTARSDTRSDTRSDFIALGGLLLNLFFSLVIVAEELPNWMLQIGD